MKLKKSILVFIIIILCVSSLSPFVYVLFISFKSKRDYFTNRLSMSLEKITLENYKKLIFDNDIFYKLISNIIVVSISCIIALLISALMAYVISIRKTNKMSCFIMGLCAIVMFLPQQITIIPEYVIYAKLGLVNNYLSVILSYASTECCFMMPILYVFCAQIPEDIIGAARLDGASEENVFISIALPMIKPGICVVLVLSAISLWNEFLVPMLLLSREDLKTITVAISGIINRNNNNPPYQMAGVVISMIPLIFIYLLCRYYLIQDLLEGDIK